MKQRIIYLLGFVLLFAGRAQAQEPTPLSLEEATDYALKHNANVKNARLDIAIQKSKNAELTGMALPQVNAKNDFMSYPNVMQSFVPAEFIGGAPGTYVAVPFTPKFSNTLSASASQILFDGTVLVVLQGKKTLMKLAELGAQSTIQDVRYRVQGSYYTLVIARKQFDLVNRSMAILRKGARDQEAMYKEGLIEKLDVDRTTVQVNNLQTDSIKLGNMLVVGEQTLKYVMGMDINNPIVLTDTALDRNLDAAKSTLLEEVDYTNRLEYNLSVTQLRYNEFDLKRNRYQSLPSLNAFGSGSYLYSSNQFGDIVKPKNYIFYSMVGVTLNIPIFSGFQRSNQVKQAKYNLEKSRNTVAFSKLSIDFETAQARNNLKSALLTEDNERRNLALANSVLDVANRKYKEGVGSSIEVNQAQTALLQSQNNYFQAQLDVISAQTDLQKALGEFAH
jgi:outer membrane protein